MRRFKLLLASALLVLAGVCAADLARPPQEQLTGRAMIAAIHLYQRTLSPVLAASGGQCRFEPSCSHYAEESVRKHGAARGSWKTAGRLVRCNPWTPVGTIDPP